MYKIYHIPTGSTVVLCARQYKKIKNNFCSFSEWESNKSGIALALSEEQFIKRFYTVPIYFEHKIDAQTFVTNILYEQLKFYNDTKFPLAKTINDFLLEFEFTEE